jgi:hypothetical protein
MNRQEFLSRSISALLHPLSLAAIFILLLNDHLLRRFWPSWFTGKLGDFAWLFFFPLFLTVLFSGVLPRRWRYPQLLVINAATCLVGGVFLLAKTAPACHTLLVTGLGKLLGIPIHLTLDPTDLIALPVLWVSWVLWQHAPQLPISRFRLAWAVMPLAAFLTIANSMPVFIEGINWLHYEDGKIYAASAQMNDAVINCSEDGGKTWGWFTGCEVPVDLYNFENYCSPGKPRENKTDIGWQTIDLPDQPGMQIHYQPNQDIEISMDGGQTWKVEYPLKPITQAGTSHFKKTTRYKGEICVIDSPITAVLHPPSGNIVFAMGLEGILVRLADGNYQ